ncbi:chitinase-3-like protein 1 [Amblyomma americanum]
MNYVETCRRAGHMGWRRTWATYASTPYITKGDQWVSYDDKDSADVKVRWFRDRWLGGGFVWTVDEDDYAGNCRQSERYPIVNVMHNVLKDYYPFNIRRSANKRRRQ